MAPAIEPMITLGTSATRELNDHWTVATATGRWPRPDGGQAQLAARGIELSATAAA